MVFEEQPSVGSGRVARKHKNQSGMFKKKSVLLMTA